MFESEVQTWIFLCLFHLIFSMCFQRRYSWVLIPVVNFLKSLFAEWSGEALIFRGRSGLIIGGLSDFGSEEQSLAFVLSHYTAFVTESFKYGFVWSVLEGFWSNFGLICFAGFTLKWHNNVHAIAATQSMHQQCRLRRWCDLAARRIIPPFPCDVRLLLTMELIIVALGT